MPARIISQRRFAKLVAATGVLSQPPGSVPRLSNLLFTQRGSLQIADGSKSIATVSGTYTNIEVLAPFSNYQASNFPYYSCLALRPTPTVTDVTNFAATVNVGTGTNNTHGTYFFGIVARAVGGHSDITPTQILVSSVVNFDGLTFTWTAVAGATGYTLYRYYVTGGDPSSWPVVPIIAVGLVTTYIFSGVLPATPQIAVPVGNTTYPLQLFTGAVPPGGALAFNAVTAGVFPSVLPQAATLAPGDPNFSSTLTIPGFSPYGGLYSAYGSLYGAACPIPQLLQFAGYMILILGNGYAPYLTDPSQGASAAVTALANTFTAAYPTWQSTVSWLTGSQIQVASGGTNYLFTAQQGGVSGSTTPTFTFATGDLVADNSVLWVCGGPITLGVAPRGAAHAVAYAGSLWLANTAPVQSSDNLDGPTCLKMSDANNPNSWNPINIAFIGRDDGTQITGLQTFTIAALGISPTGSLCVFKEFTTYQVIGVFGSSTFEIQPAQTNLGCIAARSIQFIPGFGVVRFSHLGFAVFNGIEDRLISEDIRPYLFGGADSESDITPVDRAYVYLSKSAQTVTPPMYFCAMPLSGASGALTRLFCYDLVMKSWAVLDLPWAITSLGTVAVGEGYPLVLAGKADGTLQRMQSGDLNWDQGAGDQSTVDWGFRTPDVFGEGSSQRLFYEQVAVRGYGSAAMVQSIIANLWLDGAQIGAQAVDIVPQGGSNLFEARVKIFKSGYRAHLNVSGNNGGAAGVIDAVDWAVSPKSSLARRIIG